MAVRKVCQAGRPQRHRAEETLKDRSVFASVSACPSPRKTPDEATYVRFRARLRDASIRETLFGVVVKPI